MTYTYRSTSTHHMSPIIKKIFLGCMPRLMMMRRTHYSLPDYDDTAPPRSYHHQLEPRDSLTENEDLMNGHHEHEIDHEPMENVCYDDYHKDEENGVMHQHFENNMAHSSCK